MPLTSTTSRNDQDRSVRTLIFEVKLPTGENLALVEYESGKFDILRAGSPIADDPWQVADLDSCIGAFRGIVRGEAPLDLDEQQSKDSPAARSSHRKTVN